MRGHVPTPPAVVDAMVSKLFYRRRPRATDTVIDPGCGSGPFIAGVLRYCRRLDLEPPRILGVELDPKHLRRAREAFADEENVELREVDYLAAKLPEAEFIIGNPPYVAITGLDEAERARYRARFSTAVGRFDLYMLFFERSLELLRPGGRLCFITPEKFASVATAAPLRKLLGANAVLEIEHVDEETFPDLVTYPTITTLVKRAPSAKQQTRVIERDGKTLEVVLPQDGTPWPAAWRTSKSAGHTATLRDAAQRISCGVATGADDVFVVDTDSLRESLRKFAHPTLAGRALPASAREVHANGKSMLVPYKTDGTLLPEEKLGALGRFLADPTRKAQLEARTCVSGGRKPWYAFHDNAPLDEILVPKIVCKDIAEEPSFAVDRAGAIVPRHSVYYIVPRAGVDLDRLLRYLNSRDAKMWLRANCQRAAKGFLRLQSTVLKQLPVPDDLLPAGRRAIPKRS
ncbi:MAG: Eco57I restriction-modification methylase domain-containing protein [Thermoplasmatota archaeon]